MTDVPEPEPRVRVFKEIAAATVATVAALIPEPAGDEPAPRRRLSDTHMPASLRIEPEKLSRLTIAARRHVRAHGREAA